MKTDIELKEELTSFSRIWKCGFRTGYQVKRNQKNIEEYLKDNIKSKDIVFEIGCGGGFWTKLLSQLAQEVYCNDAKTEEDNRLFDYLKNNNYKNNVIFNKVNDFELNYIEDNSLDFVFSYDVFCHISLTGQKLYLKNLYSKCKKGCKLMIMYADARKYLNSEPENRWHVVQNSVKIKNIENDEELIQAALDDCDTSSIDGKWYYIGKENFINSCKEVGYTIITEDLDIDKTNPITLCTK